MPTNEPDANDRFHGWVRPGPRPPDPSSAATEAMGAAPGAPSDLVPGEHETLDYLAGHFRIFQLRSGHRYSVDDALTAWYGTSWAPRVARALDLGSGISSVALFVAWRCPGAQLVTLEAQAASLALARRSVRYNGLTERFVQLHGDLRDSSLLIPQGTFDLVTGTPPYWATHARTHAAHPQAVPARLEVRGDVADYARAAAAVLAPGGVFAFCLPNDQRERAEQAVSDAGLCLLRRRDALFKEGSAYGITLYLAARTQDVPVALHAQPWVEPPLVLRSASGAFSAEYARVRLSYGFPPGQTDA